MNTMNVNNSSSSSSSNPTMSTTIYPDLLPSIVTSQPTLNTGMAMSSSPIGQTTTRHDGHIVTPTMVVPTAPTGTTTATFTAASTHPPTVIPTNEGPYSVKTVEFKFISISTEHFGTKQVQGFFRFQVIRDDSTGCFFPLNDPNFSSTKSDPESVKCGTSSLAVAMASATTNVLGDLFVDLSSNNKNKSNGGQMAGSSVPFNCMPEEIKSNFSVKLGGVPATAETAPAAVDTTDLSTSSNASFTKSSTTTSSVQYLPIKGQICGPILYIGINADSNGFQLSPVDPSDPMTAKKQELASINVMDFIRRGYGLLNFFTADKVHLQLFCVLSEKNYNMDTATFLQGVVRNPALGIPSHPQWEKLRKAYTKRCGHMFHEATRTKQITSLVNEYIRFQALKIVRNDFNSKIFSPSAWVSGVWQTHLSMMEDYSADIMAFCRQIQVIRCTKFDGYPSWTWVGPTLTDPMVEKDHIERYKLTYSEMAKECDHPNHLWYKSMLNLIMEHAPLPDMTWWPKPSRTHMEESSLLPISPEVKNAPLHLIISSATEQQAPVTHTAKETNTVGKKKLLSNSSTSKKQTTKKVGSKGKSKKKIKAKENQGFMSKEATKSKTSSSPPSSSKTRKAGDEDDIRSMHLNFEKEQEEEIGSGGDFSIVI